MLSGTAKIASMISISFWPIWGHLNVFLKQSGLRKSNSNLITSNPSYQQETAVINTIKGFFTFVGGCILSMAATVMKPKGSMEMMSNHPSNVKHCQRKENQSDGG